MTRQILLLRAVCLLSLLALPSIGFACRCPESISLTSSYRQAQVVLVGRVMVITGDINKDGATARIRVSQAWKQEVGNEVEVFTHTTCAFEFKAGEEYLLYLAAPSQGAAYSTKKCMGNLPLADAKEALAWLKRKGKLTQPVNFSPK